MSKPILSAAAIVVFAFTPLWGQQQGQSDMSKMSASEMRDMPGMGNDGSAHAMQSVEGRHMDMGPHMKMTALRDLRPGDREKADQVVVAARKVAEKYVDFKVALADGYKIFMPNRPQKQYHFTNYWYAFEASKRFNPDHPTSLLYEKQGDGYKLIGVMYTAPKNTDEEELDSPIPLSIVQWYAHVNLCVPPDDKRSEMGGPNPQFGLHGSITTKEACDPGGGKFMPQIFGWMVHVYPFEQKPEDVWSVERQATTTWIVAAVPWKQGPACAGPNRRGTGHRWRYPPRSIILRLAVDGGSRPECQWCCCGSPIGSAVPSSVSQTVVTIDGSAAG